MGWRDGGAVSPVTHKGAEDRGGDSTPYRAAG